MCWCQGCVFQDTAVGCVQCGGVTTSNMLCFGRWACCPASLPCSPRVCVYIAWNIATATATAPATATATAPATPTPTPTPTAAACPSISLDRFPSFFPAHVGAPRFRLQKPDSELEALREVFAMFDPDGSGAIDSSEFANLLEKVGRDPSEGSCLRARCCFGVSCVNAIPHWGFAACAASCGHA